MTTPGAILDKYLRAARQNPAYARFLIAGFISSLGFWLQNAAQFWIVINLTHSGAMLGALSLCLYGPYAVFGLLGGAVADRFDRRTLMIGSQLILALLAAILAIWSAQGGRSVAPIFAISLLRSVAMCVGLPARQAFLRGMLDRDTFSNAVSLNASSMNLARIIGPAIAGVLLTTVGAWACFALNAASYLAVVEAVVRMKPAAGAIAPPAAGRRLLRETLAGVAYVWRVPHLLFLAGSLLIVSFLSISFSTILPVYAEATLGGDARTYGALLSALGLGAVLGSLYSGALGQRAMRLIFLSAAAIGTGELLLALPVGFPAALVLLAAVGFAMTCFTTSINSVMMLDARPDMHGRVGAVYSYVVVGLSPVGSAISGWLAQQGGAGLAFAAGGVVAVCAGLAGLLRASLLAHQRIAYQDTEIARPDRI